MIFLGGLTRVTDEVARVSQIHYMPFDNIHGLGKSEEQLLLEGVLVEIVPDVEIILDKEECGLYVNLLTKAVWYEYRDRIDVENDRISQIENAIGILAEQVAKNTLLTGGNQ